MCFLKLNIDIDTDSLFRTKEIMNNVTLTQSTFAISSSYVGRFLHEGHINTVLYILHFEIFSYIGK